MDTEIVDVVSEDISKGDIRVLVVGAALGGILIGFAGGFELAKRRLKTKYEKLAEKEIAEARAFYNRLNKEVATPQEAVEVVSPLVGEAADAMLRYQGQSVTEEDTEPDVTVDVNVNVFTENEPDEVFDLEREKLNRTSKAPYIISHEEFLEAEPEYNQVTLTYYEGDDTLVDEKDDPIPIPDDIVGEESLQRFGYGSDSSRSVYVRNDRLALDFEVVKSDGKFAHEVLGLQHSDESSRHRDRHERRNQNRKFRGGNE